MLIAKPPHIILLEKMIETVQPIDFLDRAGIAINTIRHARHRHALQSELNCLTFRWIRNEDPGDGDATRQLRNAQERVRHMLVDIEVDLKLPPELEGTDPTGWLFYSNVAAVAMEALRDEDTSAIYPGFCDWIIDGDEDPDEDSKPDTGRLVKSATVVYRVRSDQPNVLLGQGVMG